MKLFYYRDPGGIKNFGDDLNPWLWQRLLPGVFDADASTLFVGIGTILNDAMPKATRTVVFGSGVGYGKGIPRVDDTWKIYCLRGPLTAKALGVSPELAVSDPAMLIGRLVNCENTNKKHRYAYMPHLRNASQAWEEICQSIGFGYIDPRWSVDRVLAAFNQTGTLITEAMHGAIVADALRIPWIAVYTGSGILKFKWQDWCLSVGLDYAPKPLLPYWYPDDNFKAYARARNWARKQRVKIQLAYLARTTRPSLTTTANQERVVTELEARIDTFKQDLAAGHFASTN